MTFTDDDLKRLKENYLQDLVLMPGKSGGMSLLALLARLEAAERVIDNLPDELDSDETHRLYWEWKKAAGK